MKLDIVVPHYREPWDVCKYLFDTIATQRGVCFDNIRVLVVNDGDCLLSDDFIGAYPYKIDYHAKGHAGVSAARNYGLDHATAEYVMFCDIDDGFLNNYALHVLFSAMQDGADLIIPNFIEETFDANGNAAITNHDQDLTFMHGKVYRRQFLIDNKLRFDESMTIHEDGYFNMLVYAVAQHCGKIKTISTPLYIWRWNDNSVVRSNRKDFVLRTYDDVIKTRIGLCSQLKERGYNEDFETAVCMTVMNSYYDFQKSSYQEARNDKHRRNAEKAFKRFWNIYKKVFTDCTNKKIADVARLARENAFKNGFLFESQDLRGWLRHIENEVTA